MPEPKEVTDMKNNCKNREYVLAAVKIQRESSRLCR